jgi:hypothetical protein
VQTSDAIYAKLSIRWKTDKLETRVHVEPGRFVVLGATGQHARDSEDTLYCAPPAAVHSMQVRPCLSWATRKSGAGQEIWHASPLQASLSGTV